MKRKIESQLLAWKEKETGRMPLILGGARQIVYPAGIRAGAF